MFHPLAFPFQTFLELSDRILSLGRGRTTAGEKKVAGPAAAAMGWAEEGAGEFLDSGAAVGILKWAGPVAV